MVKITISEHIFVEADGYWLEGYHVGSDVLVVTFEAYDEPYGRPDGMRPGWGSSFFRARGISHLCVKPKCVDWYQGEGLAKAFAELKAQGFFARYAEIVTYGNSMGGFAALAYSDFIGATRVLALSPQSTMDMSKVGWETRYPVAQRQNWSGRFSDAQGMSSHVSQFVIVADIHHWPDRRHVHRLAAPNVTILNLPFVGHILPVPLRAIGLLSTLVMQVVSGQLDEHSFRRVARKRRELPVYYNELRRKARAKSRSKLKKIVLAAQARALSK